MTRPLIITQSRVESSRFPGKMLHPLLGQPMLLWHLARLAQMQTEHDLIVACPDTPLNHALKDLCERHGYRCVLVKGDPDDVLSRYMKVAEVEDANIIIRTCGDCPLIDPYVVDELLQSFQEACCALDYLGMAATWPEGSDVDVFSRKTLKTTFWEATLPSDREHVVPFMRRNAHRFTCALYPCLFDFSRYQYSVDTLEHFEVAQELLRHLMRDIGLTFTVYDVWQIIEANPELQQAMRRRGPRNPAYVAQVEAERGVEGLTWEQLLHEGSHGQSEVS